MTQQQIVNEYTEIYNDLQKRLEGGLMYGLDFRTIQALYPAKARRLKLLLTLLETQND